MKIRVFKISEITSYIKNLITRDIILSSINAKGEITNLSRHINGHLFFTLKDEFSKIQCIMYRDDANKLNFMIEEGMEVRVSAKIDLYSKEGRYQLNVASMLPEGIAAGYEKFLILREKLSKKGYFDKNKKKKINKVKKLGIITSKSGAAIHDFMKVLNRRNPFVEVYFYPSLVQGDNASITIINGIKSLSKIENLDCIVISRGGGSKEDLSVFNDENIANAIYNTTIPVVSAVGHEIDTTICDLCADLRAATPTEAAELITEEFYQEVSGLKNLEFRLHSSISQKKYNCKKALESFNIASFDRKINLLLDKSLQDINNYLLRYRSIIDSRLLKIKLNLDYSSKTLENLNPKSILKKGYAIVSDEKGKTITSCSNVKNGIKLNIEFYDGVVNVKSEIKEKI